MDTLSALVWPLPVEALPFVLVAWRECTPDTFSSSMTSLCEGCDFQNLLTVPLLASLHCKLEAMTATGRCPRVPRGSPPCRRLSAPLCIPCRLQLIHTQCSPLQPPQTSCKSCWLENTGRARTRMLKGNHKECFWGGVAYIQE